MTQQDYENSMINERNAQGGDWAAYTTPSGIQYMVRNATEGPNKGYLKTMNHTTFMIHDPTQDVGTVGGLDPIRQRIISNEVLSHYKTTPAGQQYGFGEDPGDENQPFRQAGELPGQYGGFDPTPWQKDFQDIQQNSPLGLNIKNNQLAKKMGTQRGPGTINGNLV